MPSLNLRPSVTTDTTQTKESKPEPLTGQGVSVKRRRPLSYIRFGQPVVLFGTDLPITTWEQGKTKTEWPRGYKNPGAWLDLDRGEIHLGPDIFPHAGGLISQYRYAKLPTGPAPKLD